MILKVGKQPPGISPFEFTRKQQIHIGSAKYGNRYVPPTKQWDPYTDTFHFKDGYYKDFIDKEKLRAIGLIYGKREQSDLNRSERIAASDPKSFSQVFLLAALDVSTLGSFLDGELLSIIRRASDGNAPLNLYDYPNFSEPSPLCRDFDFSVNYRYECRAYQRKYIRGSDSTDFQSLAQRLSEGVSSLDLKELSLLLSTCPSLPNIIRNLIASRDSLQSGRHIVDDRPFDLAVNLQYGNRSIDFTPAFGDNNLAFQL